MIRQRTLGTAALLLVLAPAVAAQEPADPMAGMRAQIDSMQRMMQEMHHMMMSMHGQGGMMMGGMQGGFVPDGHEVPAPQGMGGMGMGGMGMQGAQGQQGAMTMGGMGAQQGVGCAMTGPDAGVAALFDRSIAGLQLTDAQRVELQAILGSARTEALAKLTPEQRARLDLTPPAGGAAACGGLQAAGPHH
jgi:hypothetical protein